MGVRSLVRLHFVVYFLLKSFHGRGSHSLLFKVVPVTDCTDEEGISELVRCCPLHFKSSVIISDVVGYGVGSTKVTVLLGFDQSSRFVWSKVLGRWNGRHQPLNHLVERDEA